MLKWYLAESADILQKYYCDQLKVHKTDPYQYFTVDFCGSIQDWPLIERGITGAVMVFGLKI